MYQPKMTLTAEQMDILQGKQGETKAKMMESLVMFGDIFEAPRLVKLDYKGGHIVTSFGLGLLTPVYKMMDELIAEGMCVDGYFTADPRPLDYENVKSGLVEKLVFNHFLYSKQEPYEKQLKKLGLRDDKAFTCACYLDEVGNIPQQGDVLSWAESSAVVYANSVLGARCNRNSGVIELIGSLLGYVPEFGLVTEEGRRATWKVTVKTTQKPEAQVLGSAIGMKVLEDVPYVVGMDQWLGDDLTDDVKAYFKDFGAATASNGSVGLYHIDNLTPEAKEQGETLLEDNYQEYVIDDAELERVYRSYPIMWAEPEKDGDMAFIGCPHLSFAQLNEWTDKLCQGLAETGKSTVTVKTILTSAPNVIEKFKQTPKYKELLATGAKLSYICPLMYTNNPITKKYRIMTCSNKLRTYSMARYYKSDDLLNILVGKEVK